MIPSRIFCPNCHRALFKLIQPDFNGDTIKIVCSRCATQIADVSSYSVKYADTTEIKGKKKCSKY